MKVTNRFKGLDLTDRVHEDLWTEVHGIVQEAGIKERMKELKILKLKKKRLSARKEMQKGKMVV